MTAGCVDGSIKRCVPWLQCVYLDVDERKLLCVV